MSSAVNPVLKKLVALSHLEMLAASGKVEVIILAEGTVL
jgi:hypothetical protein